MPDFAHFCVECETIHNALLWYVRVLDDGTQEYLCAEKFNLIFDKPQWRLLDPTA
jgi:hypothetical protein